MSTLDWSCSPLSQVIDRVERECMNLLIIEDVLDLLSVCQIMVCTVNDVSGINGQWQDSAFCTQNGSTERRKKACKER